MFNTAQWKRKKFNNEASLRNYTDYPPRTATHTEEETYISCQRCNKIYNTDARKPVEGGGYNNWVYRPVTDFITFQRGANAYFCVSPCK